MAGHHRRPADLRCLVLWTLAHQQADRKNALFVSRIRGGTTVIPLQKGDFCTITSTDNGRAFTSDKLNRHSFKYEFSVFDVVVDLRKNSPQGRAKKGNAHGKGDKVGYGRCTADTVVGTIAIHYFGKKTGESCVNRSSKNGQ